MAYSVLDTKKIIDVIKYRFIWFALSFILLFPGILAMGYSMIKYDTHTPLAVGIDFTGGTIIQYSVKDSVSNDKVAKIRKELTEKNIDAPVIQVLKSQASEGDIISIKTNFSEDEADEQTETITSVIQSNCEDAQIAQTKSVGPVLGKQLFVNSMIAVALAVLGIVIYLTLRFRLDYAVVAIIALVHDVVFVTGVFSLLGLFCGVQVDSLFITAILTVLGFSVNDTIVIFDRIRENNKFYSKNATFDEIVNASVNQTLARSINTSFTTLLTLCAIYFFGGSTTKDFILVMILGMAIGTYSSIFTASTLIAYWNDIKAARKAKALS